MAYDRNKKLRDVAKNLHRRAGDKISRNKRFKGVNIAGTEHDPRVSAAEISKMNASELRSYSAKIGGFLSRNVQFLKGARGAPLHRDLFETHYLPAQEAYNAFVTKRREEIDNLLLPVKKTDEAQQTIGQRRSKTSKVQYGGPVYAVGDILHDPYATIHNKPGFVKSDEALRELANIMLRKMTPEYKAEIVSKDRETVEKALGQMGLMDLKTDFDKLTDEQFDILFNESSFAEYFFPRYLDMKAKMGQMDDETIDEKRVDTLEDIEWVKKAVPMPERVVNLPPEPEEIIRSITR